MAEAIAATIPGIEASSAGTWALAGSPPTAEAVIAAAEAGYDLTGLESTRLTAEIVAAADRIYGMSPEHISEVTRLGGVAELLDPDAIVDDPYGKTLDDYRRARNHIVAAIRGRTEEWAT